MTTLPPPLGRVRFEAAAIRPPARIYDMRCIEMIERHYEGLLDGALEEISGRLDALRAARGAHLKERFGR